MFGAVAVAAVLPAASQAQEQPSTELVLYPKGNYKGAGRHIAGASQSMQLFTVRSVKIPEGMSWELCSGNTFTGCTEFPKSDPGMVMTVRSVRPVAPKITTISGAVGTAVAGPNPSMRGMASEYFVAPATNGARVEVPEGSAEAMSRRAREFCRTRGWRMAVYARLQTLEGRSFLADVLCADNE
ncbi:MAG: hypothetical protein HOP96_03110 [Sphingomonas sp.]|nr:hypothetical protein [Sphingomonas sp.]